MLQDARMQDTAQAKTLLFRSKLGGFCRQPLRDTFIALSAQIELSRALDLEELMLVLTSNTIALRQLRDTDIITLGHVEVLMEALPVACREDSAKHLTANESPNIEVDSPSREDVLGDGRLSTQQSAVVTKWQRDEEAATLPSSRNNDPASENSH